jgi:hypothetical protein
VCTNRGNGGSNQQFEVKEEEGPDGRGWYRLRAKHSNQCIAIKNGNLGNGEWAIQAQCITPGFVQQFRLVPAR